MLCFQCGRENDEGNQYCRHCHQPLVDASNPEPPLPDLPSPCKRSTYIWLATFLGIFGVNDFHIGRSGAGTFKLTLTLSSFLWGWPLFLISAIWSGVQIFTQKRDGEQRMLQPCSKWLRFITGGVLTLMSVGLTLFLLAALLAARAAASNITTRSDKCRNELTELYRILRDHATENRGVYPDIAWLGYPSEEAPNPKGRKERYAVFAFNLKAAELPLTAPLAMDASPSACGGHHVLRADGTVELVRREFPSYADAVRFLTGGKPPPQLLRNARALDRELAGAEAVQK